MDEADIAARNSRVLENAEIERIHQEAQKSIRGTGFCLECGEPVSGPGRWCCIECRDVWAKKNEK